MKIVQNISALFLCTCLSAALALPALASSWVGVYGGPKNEWGDGILATSDGGYLVTGETDSFAAGGIDALVMKLDAQGSIQWTRVMGGALDDYFVSAVEMPEGGYIVAGGSYSFTSGSLARTLAPWVVRLDASGNILWQKYYATPLAAGIFKITRTRDGGFILCGHWWADANQPTNGFLMKITASGDLVWQTAYGPADYESFHGVLELSDGSFVASGIAFGASAGEGTLLKVDASGNPLWERRFQIINDYDSTDAHPSALIETPDGGLLFGGGDPGQIRKLDKDGNALWGLRVNWTYPILRAPVHGLVAAPEGGYYAVGWYLCSDNGYCPPPLLYGSMLAKISEEGSLQWAKVYPAFAWIPQTVAVCAGQGGGVALGGYSFSPSTSDLLVIKTENDGRLSDPCQATQDMPVPWTSEPSHEDWKTRVPLQTACQALVPTPSVTIPSLYASNTYCPVIQSVTILQNPFRLDVKGLGFTQSSFVYVDSQRTSATKPVSEYEVIAKKGAALKALLPKGQPVCVQVGEYSDPSYRSECFIFTR